MKTVYFPVHVTSIIRKIKMPTQPPIVKKLSNNFTILMPATLLIISVQNINQIITFNL